MPPSLALGGSRRVRCPYKYESGIDTHSLPCSKLNQSSHWQGSRCPPNPCPIDEILCVPTHAWSFHKQVVALGILVSNFEASFFTQRTNRKSGRLFLPILRVEKLCPQVSKMVTRMVRHYDQDERQLDAALPGDTIRRVLLKAFAKHGAKSTGFLRKALASTHS